jgi:hypothetical protein
MVHLEMARKRMGGSYPELAFAEGDAHTLAMLQAYSKVRAVGGSSPGKRPYFFCGRERGLARELPSAAGPQRRFHVPCQSARRPAHRSLPAPPNGAHPLPRAQELAAFWAAFERAHAEGTLPEAWWAAPLGRRWLARGRDYRLLTEPLDILLHYWGQPACRGEPWSGRGPGSGSAAKAAAAGGAEACGEEAAEEGGAWGQGVDHYADDPSDGLRHPNGARPSRYALLQRFEAAAAAAAAATAGATKAPSWPPPEDSLAKAALLLAAGGDVWLLPGMPARPAPPPPRIAGAAASEGSSASAEGPPTPARSDSECVVGLLRSSSSVHRLGRADGAAPAASFVPPAPWPLRPAELCLSPLNTSRGGAATAPEPDAEPEHNAASAGSSVDSVDAQRSEAPEAGSLPDEPPLAPAPARALPSSAAAARVPLPPSPAAEVLLPLPALWVLPVDAATDAPAAEAPASPAPAAAKAAAHRRPRARRAVVAAAAAAAVAVVVKALASRR